MAGLAIPRKKEYGLSVFVLHAMKSLTIEQRHIVVQLTCRVRVEGKTDSIGCCPDGFPRLCQCVSHFIKRARHQHVLLREGKDEHRIIRHPFPINQVIDHVVVGLERQDVPDDFDSLPIFRRQLLNLWDLQVIVQVISVIFWFAHLCTCYCHLIPVLNYCGPLTMLMA